MASPIGTIVRTGVVIGAVAYCAWPGEDSGPGGAGKPGKPLEIPTALLSPVIQAPPKRNPFRHPDAPPYKHEEPKPLAGTAGRGGIAKGPAAKAPAPNARGGEGTSATAPRGVKNTQQKPDAVDPLAGLMLNATSVSSNYRLAIINGHLYERGQPLKLLDPLSPQFVVQEVLPHKVLLRCRDKTLDLTYSNKPNPAQQSKGGTRATQPSRSATTSTVNRPRGPVTTSHGNIRAK